MESSTLGNLFAYCGNNPINMVDYTGTDAYWLINENAVGGLAHAALLIEGTGGLWWYISYFGRLDGVTVKDLQVTFKRAYLTYKSNGYLNPSEFWVYDVASPRGPYKRVWYSITEYTKAEYIAVDFSYYSLKKALYYHFHVPAYNVLKTNCAWLALEILQQSTSGETWDKIESYLYTDYFGVYKVKSTIVPRWVPISFLFG